MNKRLSQAIERFAQQTLNITDKQLDMAWAWGDYRFEGVRFAFFRVYEELRQLAVMLRHERQTITPAQQVLGQYHVAYRDLQAALWGLDPTLTDRPPAPEAWSVRQAVAHMAAADIGFHVVVAYTLERYRQGKPVQAIPEDAWETVSGMSRAKYGQFMAAPLDTLRATHEQKHGRILTDFADITDEELEAPSMFWEQTPFPLRFRLHRFDAHLRQHTVQVDKTLAQLGHLPSEGQRLMRFIYAAWAEVDAGQIGRADLSQTAIDEVAQRIEQYTAEIAHTLSNPSA